jgi:peptidoglycan DL-endopeptidase CwlO
LAHSGTPGSVEDGTPQDPSHTPQDSASVSRRSLRVGREQKPVARAASRPATASTVASTPAGSAAAGKQAAKRKGGWALNVAVMTVATGLIATMSLPAFAFNPDGAESSAFGPSAADSMKKAQSQTVQVTDVASATVGREAVSATTESQLAAQKAATAAAAAAEAARQRAAVTLTNYATSYSGPSAQDFLANPPYPNFSLDQVFSVAQQYEGTPYVYGGSTPAGFDCSGFVMYVYAQFGISLPHSVSGQATRGTRILIADARPGDLVIMSGHDGFYAGNGNILDAPTEGKSISIRPLWTSDYYIVRLYK